MKKIYYEVLEYINNHLKEMYYFATDDILLSKKKAENCYKIKKLEGTYTNRPGIQHDLVLVILDDYEANRYVISEPNDNIQQLESMILSSLTGQVIQVPGWKDRELALMNEFS